MVEWSSMENISDIKPVIEKAAAGNAESFKQIYEHLVDKIYNYVKYRTNTEDSALDLTQEVFVDLYKALPSFTYSSEEEFYGFVFKITKRKLAKHYADKHTKAAASMTSFDEEIYSTPELDLEIKDEVSVALESLDDTTREIVVLHHWSRYTFPEIATLIDMTESAVRVRHHRALKTLSAVLDSN